MRQDSTLSRQADRFGGTFERDGDVFMNHGTLTLRKLLMTESSSDVGISNELDLRALARRCTFPRSATTSHRPPVRRRVGEARADGLEVAAIRRRSFCWYSMKAVDIMRCAFEAEEREIARTQQVTAGYLLANGDVYRQASSRSSISLQAARLISGSHRAEPEWRRAGFASLFLRTRVGGASRV